MLKAGKIVIAAILALWIARFLGLAYWTAAGVIALLSVMDTRKSSLHIAWQRSLSALLAFGLGAVIFPLGHYSLLALCVFLLVYVPLSLSLGLGVGIAPSTVLVTHLWLEQSVAWSWMGNEAALFVIGTSLALVLNWYMPSRQAAILEAQLETERLMKDILWKMDDFLRLGQGKNDATLVKQLQSHLQSARHMVLLEADNQVFTKTSKDLAYVEMRQDQADLLERMVQVIHDWQGQWEEAKILAGLFYLTADQLHAENDAQNLLTDIALLKTTFRQRPLPATREEFESRAMLFQLLNDLERMISLKVAYYQDWGKEPIE